MGKLKEPQPFCFSLVQFVVRRVVFFLLSQVSFFSGNDIDIMNVVLLEYTIGLENWFSYYDDDGETYALQDMITCPCVLLETFDLCYNNRLALFPLRCF